MQEHGQAGETELIRRARRGDVKAFSRLYAEIYKDLYRFALYVTRHPQDAEDAVGDTVVTAYEKIRQLKKEESFRNWMFTILYNNCRRILKRRQKEAELESITELCHREDGEEPDHTCHCNVREAFAALDEEDRLIIAFSVFGGYRSEEIAARMEKNAATVRSRKSRALQKMRKMLV